MSPQDPLEQLLTGAFNRELGQLQSTATVDRVMSRVRRYIWLRRFMFAAVVALAMAALITTFPDFLWLSNWLLGIEFGRQAIPVALPLLGLFIPWLLVLLDDQV